MTQNCTSKVVSHHVGTRSHTWSLLRKKPVCLTAEPALQLLYSLLITLKAFSLSQQLTKAEELGRRLGGIALPCGPEFYLQHTQREEAYKFLCPFWKSSLVFFNNSRPNLKYFSISNTQILITLPACVGVNTKFPVTPNFNFF